MTALTVDSHLGSADGTELQLRITIFDDQHCGNQCFAGDVAGEARL